MASWNERIKKKRTIGTISNNKNNKKNNFNTFYSIVIYNNKYINKVNLKKND